MVVSYHVPTPTGGRYASPPCFPRDARPADCVIVVTDHAGSDYALVAHARVGDRNALVRVLGAGK